MAAPTHALQRPKSEDLDESGGTDTLAAMLDEVMEQEEEANAKAAEAVSPSGRVIVVIWRQGQKQRRIQNAGATPLVFASSVRAACATSTA